MITHHEYRGYVFTLTYHAQEPAYTVAFADLPEIITSGSTLAEAFANDTPVPRATVDVDRVDVEPHCKRDEATVGRPRHAADNVRRQRAPVLAVGIHHRQLRRMIVAALAKGERDAAVAPRLRLRARALDHEHQRE